MILVAVGLIMGTSAWAQTTYYSQDYESTTTPDWTTATGGRFTPVILEESGNHYLSVDQETRNNNGTTISSTSLQGTVAAETDFTMQFDLKLGSSNNQTPVSFTIYDAANTSAMLSLTATGTYAKTWSINGSSTTVELEGSGTIQAITNHTWYTVKYSRSGDLTYLTVTKKADGTVAFERALIDTKSEKGGLGKMEFVTRRYNANFAIDNIVVREIADGDVPEAIATTYTIKFKDESGNTIKEDAVVNSVAGIEVTASSDYTTAIYANNKKYIYKSGNDAITTVEDESSNVITLVFREAATWNYTVNATGAESAVIKVIATGTAFEGDAVTVPYPFYINVDGTLWTKGATNKEYRTTVNITEDNIESNLTYTATEITNVIYLVEGEDLEGVTIFNTGNSQSRSSNAASGYSSKDITITTLPVGKYNISGVACVATGTSNFSFNLGNREIFNIINGANNWASGSAEFVVASEKALTFTGGNSNQGLDFVYIQYLGEPTEEELAEAAAADAAADLAEAKAELQAVIDEAKAIDTTEKLGAEELAAAITAAETAYAAEDATVESLNAAQTALEEAIAAFEDANTTKYYVVGDMNSWAASADYLLTLNEEASTTEYYINGLQLTTSQGFKVIGVLGETTTWYPDGENNNYYVSADGTYDVYFRPNGDGDDSWHYNCIYAALKPTYTVAGSSDVIFGSAWDAANTDNDMTENADGTYSITYTNVALSGNVSYKVVLNHSWDIAYPASDRVIGISMAGNYDITITFNPSTGEVSETMSIYKDITAGYATYCSPYDLNFDGTGVTAYIATLSGSNVIFTEVTSAPANTGLLLKADAGSYPIAMEASSTTIENNALIGVLENTHVDKGAFVLMNGTSGVGFYKTNNDEGFTVGAYTAYLPALATSRSFIAINSDGTTTAIEKIENGKLNIENGVYDLQGRRIESSTLKKGLYIVNGKKVIK